MRSNTIREFWSRVDVELATGCWLWTGTDNGQGYGVLRWHGRQWRAHRLAYEVLRGPIHAQTLDHLCPRQNRAQPNHLEPVPNKDNVLRGNGITAQNKRKTHCKYGHPITGVERHPDRIGRRCLTCGAQKARMYRAAIREQQP